MKSDHLLTESPQAGLVRRILVTQFRGCGVGRVVSLAMCAPPCVVLAAACPPVPLAVMLNFDLLVEVVSARFFHLKHYYFSFHNKQCVWK